MRQRERRKLKVPKHDWTMAPGTHISNSSPVYLKICNEVESIIRGEAHTLIAGRANDTARLIVSHLAHVHRFAPERI